MTTPIELTNHANQLYDRALKNWGHSAQMDMVQEEAAELIQAVSKKKREGLIPFPTAKDDDLASEIADVRIMCAQLERMFRLEKNVEGRTSYKLLRLEERLNNWEKIK